MSVLLSTPLGLETSGSKLMTSRVQPRRFDGRLPGERGPREDGESELQPSSLDYAAAKA